YKACHLTRLLTSAGALVQVVLTPAATRFVGADTFSALSGRRAFTDVFSEPGTVLHVRLAHEADIAVVAPATANILAKLAHGLADDLLSSTLLEARCPLVVAPAMHTGMWENPATQANVAALETRGVRFVGPASGELAAGDEGIGRMVESEFIRSAVEALLRRDADLSGRTIVVTAGSTHEPIDAVRFVGNRSSGKMGFAIADEATARGADVILVSGPASAPKPAGVRLVEVSTAEEMLAATGAAVGGSDALIMAAAVADFRPAAPAGGKLKKADGAPELELVPTPDILSELAGALDGRVVVGFAAETEDLEAAGREKLRAKGLDLIVVNEVGRPGTGFGSDTNDALILSADGDDAPLATWTKAALAAEVCDRLVKLLDRSGA
ncbi:MAG: bifunctional phosphopantothenoylcysteine decarboxylase/phosphopantothenate--cysteine ligase CoaBC, partial [Actinomycetota bacterium]|nr:bifunctional phosphopantothenoylcysteine decarboxylase/phosphopantothenate--cysteine ligase CoaBC [Actinomycetota bacterium]